MKEGLKMVVWSLKNDLFKITVVIGIGINFLKVWL